MLFNSIDFIIFFPIVLIIYYLIPKKLQTLWLLICSYYFYMSWNPKYAVLILLSTTITYISGLLIEKVKNTKKDSKNITLYKKIVVFLSFALNLSILFYFKYFNFFINIVSRLMLKFNILLNVPTFDIILPVGISFYTFQALSYTMDVYRDDIYAEKSFIKYALFVSFFPQLVAGPIERSKNLLKQLANNHNFSYENLKEGFLIMLWGFFLKIVLADRIAIFVDNVYGNYQEYTGVYFVVATILFAVQIYCDFSGYSTIAMGASKILGIQLMENFNAPYLSTSVAEFWRKWHISLTSWFKDYLYIPLGGNRKGKIRKYINIMIVFLTSGLWHGASLSFVVWGGLNGLYQIAGELFKSFRDAVVRILDLDRSSIGHKMLCGLLTFVLIDFTWIFFRADSVSVAISIIKSIIMVHNPWILFDGRIYNCGLTASDFSVVEVSILILLLSDICKRKKVVIRNIILKQDFWFRCLFISLSVCLILIFGVWGPSFSEANFIYFQF